MRESKGALSRRSLLHGMGAIASASAVTACIGSSDDRATSERTSAAQSPLGKDARIVIVGAGLAGMTCALRLAQRGFSPVVYDANNRVGGRTFTLRSSAFPNKVELGGEFIDTGHPTMQGLVAELGLTLVDVIDPSLELERYFINNRHFTEPEIVELFRPVAKQLREDFKSIGQPRYATFDAFTPRGRELDLMSIEQWLDDHDVTGPIRKILDIGYTAEFGAEIDEQSFLNLLYLISFDPDPFQIYGDSDERYIVKEGNDQITARIQDQLPSPVKLGHRLEAIKEKADGTLRVTFAKGASTVEVIADKLVVAIPFNQLRKCSLKLPLSPAKALAINTVAYGRSSKVIARVSSRPWLAQGTSGTTFNDRVYHETWDASRGFAGAAAAVTNFGGGDVALAMGAGSSLSQAKTFLDRLDVVFPGVRAAFTGQTARMHWPTAPFFEGGYAVWAPGNYTTFVGSEALIEGNVHFCGEHTSTDFQGWMEGAAESGERVAKEVRKAINAT